MRVLVCGSRDFTDEWIIHTILAAIDAEYFARWTLIEGGATGADRIAQTWAKEILLDKQLETYEADWEQYGKAAGMIRNKQMLTEGKPDLVLAFTNKPLSESRGTANMVKQAKAAGVRTYIIEGA